MVDVTHCTQRVHACTNTILRPVEKGVATFQFQKNVVLLGEPYQEGGQWMGWLIPFNCGLWMLHRRDGILGHGLPAPVSRDDADSWNTSLVTCRGCGGWLQYGTCVGYGTEDGTCGVCLSDTERGE